jgi:hypothetical protein
MACSTVGARAAGRAHTDRLGEQGEMKEYPRSCAQHNAKEIRAAQTRTVHTGQKDHVRK